MLAYAETECVDGQVARQGDYTLLVEPYEAESLRREYPGLYTESREGDLMSCGSAKGTAVQSKTYQEPQ